MSGTAGSIDLAALLAVPHHLAAPDAVAQALLPSLDAASAAGLLSSTRLTSRLDDFITNQLEPAALDALVEPDSAIIAAGPDGWRAIALIAGAIYHAVRVRRLVAGADIARFTTRCGAAARHAALTVIAPEIAPETASACLGESSEADLDAAVEAAGEAAFAAWRASLPAGWRQRLALLSRDPEGNPMLANSGLANNPGLAALYRQAAPYGFR